MPNNDTQDQLEALRLSYLASLPDKQNAIRSNWQQLVSQWNPESFDSLHIILHGLAGSAETFGLPDVTQDARELVNTLKLLSKSSPPDQATLDTFDRALVEFMAHLTKSTHTD